MSDRVIGTCSLCGGAVTLPSVWYGTVPPKPTCSSCGAEAKPQGAPVIDMQPTKAPHVPRVIKTRDE